MTRNPIGEGCEDRCCDCCDRAEVRGYRRGRAVNAMSLFCELNQRYVAPRSSCPEWLFGDPWEGIR